MFKISLKNTYTWPVKVEIAADGGKPERHTFDAEFKRLPQDQLDALLRRATAAEITDKEVLDEVLVGWKGVQDEDGEELPVSEVNREKLLNIHPVTQCIASAWAESIHGARRKN